MTTLVIYLLGAILFIIAVSDEKKDPKETISFMDKIGNIFLSLLWPALVSAAILEVVIAYLCEKAFSATKPDAPAVKAAAIDPLAGTPDGLVS